MKPSIRDLHFPKAAPIFAEYAGPCHIGQVQHWVNVRWCVTCGEVISLFHHGCCGHLSSGFGSVARHVCTEPK